MHTGEESKVSYIADYAEKRKMTAVLLHRVIAYTCKYWNISVVSAVFIEMFQHNQQYDTLLPITPCVHN
jgi:hypothetical protein